MSFALSDEGDIPLLNLTKYETRLFHDSKGREIAVFDNIVDKSDLDTLRLYLLHYNSVFRYQAFDGQDEEHDNVSWIAMLQVKLSQFSIVNCPRLLIWDGKVLFYTVLVAVFNDNTGSVSEVHVSTHL